MVLVALTLVAASAAAAVAQKINVDDRDPRVQYYPSIAQWTVHTNQQASWALFNNSDTFSDVQGAYASFTFNGTGIEYWGNQGPYHGDCLIKVDGQERGTVTSNAPQDGPPILLYQQTNLAPDQPHTITVTVVPPAYPNVCEIDRFVVDTGSRNSSSHGGSGHSGGSDDDSSSVPLGAVIGGAVGGAVLIGGLILFFILRRRKQKRNNLEKINWPEGLDGPAKVTPYPDMSSETPARPVSTYTQATTMTAGAPTHLPPTNAPAFPVPAPAPAPTHSHPGHYHAGYETPISPSHFPLPPSPNPPNSAAQSSFSYAPVAGSSSQAASSSTAPAPVPSGHDAKRREAARDVDDVPEDAPPAYTLER